MRRGPIRLLHETLGHVEFKPPGLLPGISGLDVSIGAAGFGGRNADRQQDVVCGAQFQAGPQRLPEHRQVPDDMVGGQHAEHSLRIPAPDPGRARGNGGGGIAADRFAQHGHGAPLPQQLPDRVYERLIGHDQGALGCNDAGQALYGFDDQGLASSQGQQLLWAAGRAERPKTFSPAAGHDQCVYVVGNAHVTTDFPYNGADINGFPALGSKNSRRRNAPPRLFQHWRPFRERTAAVPRLCPGFDVSQIKFQTRQAGVGGLQRFPLFGNPGLNGGRRLRPVESFSRP